MRPEALQDVLAVFRRHGIVHLVLGEVVEGDGVWLARADGSRAPLPEYWSDQTDSGDDRVQRWIAAMSSL